MHYHYEDRPLGSGRAVKEAARSVGAAGTLVVSVLEYGQRSLDQGGAIVAIPPFGSAQPLAA